MATFLLVHNHYLYEGGEDQSFEADAALLESYGHRVVRYTAHNESISGMSFSQLAGATLWNNSTYRDCRHIIRRERPAIVHFHNTFPLISPAAYYAARAEGVPVVQSLRNYRLGCVNALFFREGKVCEDCVGRSAPWRGVLHGCYRKSRVASAGVATLIGLHRTIGTWTRMVDVYVALTDFARDKFIQIGLPVEKLVVRPNFLQNTPDVGRGGGNYAVFAGRLFSEKGLDTLIAAWRLLGDRIGLKIIGDGPLSSLATEAANTLPGVEYCGHMSMDGVFSVMGDAKMVIFPSRCYETFGRVAMESYAMGTPVIGSNIGAIADIIDDGRTGLHFTPGDAEDLVVKVLWMLEHPEALARMRHEARHEFESRFTAACNYQLLMEIYEKAAGLASARGIGSTVRTAKEA